jgi:hypothetical protein
MKVSVENWKDVERKIREVGIEESKYDSNDVLQTTVLKNGERYEFIMELFKELQSKGLITFKLGRRIEIKGT